MARGRHEQSRRARRLLGMPVLASALAVVLALGGAGAVLALSRHGVRGPDTTARRTADSSVASGRTAADPTTTTAPPVPLAVVSVSPAPGSASAAFDTDVAVRFNQPVTGAVLPSVSPAPPGDWTHPEPDVLEFRPSGNFVPFEKVTLVVPGGPAGVRSRSGTLLASSYTASFTIEAASVLRLQQLLAELDYLPLAFVPPAGSSSGSSSALAHEPTTSSAIPLDPQPGSFAWRFPNIPPSLAALWQPGAPNVITTGAVMAFESDHGLADDGVAGPLVWSALLQAVAQRQVDTAPYDYVMVSTALPETLRVWRDGTVIFSSLANTGIPASPTQLGTWPVYLRYLSTTMSGYNPDGTYYSDPGVPWVSYFHGGDAIHGFLRASYGFPQSLGCVELPYAAAETVWPMTPIGTLVTVS